MKIKFYGVRGSIPTPLSGDQVQDKIARVIRQIQYVGADKLPEINKSLPYIDSVSDTEAIKQWLEDEMDFNLYSTYGGNTTCMELRCNKYPIIFDMGTGIRALGDAMIPEILGNNGIRGTVLQSHLHWDHIQGMPFWKPLFMPSSKFDNQFTFFGGKEWDSQLEVVLQGQMNHPVFPVRLEELQASAMSMKFDTIYDGWGMTLESAKAAKGKVSFSQDPLRFQEGIGLLARKLNHPQETFGYRVTFQGNTLAFTTDHEPYAAGIHNNLRELVDGVDLWVTDAQYSHDMYTGKKDGIQKFGWGHSYPEYIAEVAKECSVKRVITTHHDPASTDEDVERIAQTVWDNSQVHTEPAYEGMEIEI